MARRRRIKVKPHGTACRSRACHILIACLTTIASPAPADETGPASAVHRTHDYSLTIRPHPNLGRCPLKTTPDRPIMAFYGGLGLHDLGNGRWTGYNVRAKSDIDRLMQRCSDFGIHRIYASLLEQPQFSLLLAPPSPNSEDLIPYAIEQAHARGIQVYGDLPIFAASPLNKPFLDANPHVFTRNERGEPTPHMISPAYPEVRGYKRAIILEWLSKYPLDGVQLDFIRWPYFGQDLLRGVCEHGYDEPLLRDLRQRHNLPEDFRPRPEDPRFLRARQRLISLFIRELRDDLRRNGIDLPIGVYNSNAYGRLQSLHDVCQDWRDWENKRLVDEHHPMFLMDSLTRLGRATWSLTAVKRPGSIVFGPLFLAEGFHPDEGFVPTPDLCREAARRVIKLGCDGIWFCRGSEIEEFGLWPVVREIGQYSLAQFRSEDFDPLYENLVENGDFESGAESWQITPEARLADERAKQGGTFLRIDLRPDHPVVIHHRERVFCHHPGMAVRSLGLAARYRIESGRASGPFQIVLTLRYTNGETETESLDLDPGHRTWTTSRTAFRVVRRPPEKLLRSAQVAITLPPGDGTVLMDDVEMTYDPLDNPLAVETSTPTP